MPKGASGYRYKQIAHGGRIDGFQEEGFDDSAWAAGQAPFGNGGCGLPRMTEWDVDTDLLVRRKFNVPAGTGDVEVRVQVDNDVIVWVNGNPVGAEKSGFACTTSDNVGPFRVEAAELHQGADNVLAVRAHDYGGATYLDLAVTPVGPGSQPNLKVVAGAANQASGVPGDSVAVSWTTRNPTAFTATAPWEDAVYLSDDAFFDPGTDQKLGSVGRASDLLGGDQYSSGLDIAVPSKPAGSYHLIVHSDDGLAFAESTELDNVFVIPFTVTSETAPCIAGPPPAGTTPAGAQTWKLADDFATSDSNPAPDSHGNAGVWHFCTSAGLAHEEGGYTKLPLFDADILGSGLKGWYGSPVDCASTRLGIVLVNPVSTDVSLCTAVVPGHAVAVHPTPARMAIVAWRSPVSGSIRVAGGVSDIDPNGGDGVQWLIAKGSGAPLDSGAIVNGGSQEFSSALAVDVEVGDVLYFGVHPGGGDDYDSTKLDITLTLGEPGDPCEPTIRTLSNGDPTTTDGALQIPVDGLGEVGDDGTGTALYNPPGDLDAKATLFYGGLYASNKDEFLADCASASSTVVSESPSALTTSAQVGELGLVLNQSVDAPAPDGSSRLTQSYAFTNPTGAPQPLVLAHLFDADLSFLNSRFADGMVAAADGSELKILDTNDPTIENPFVEASGDLDGGDGSPDAFTGQPFDYRTVVVQQDGVHPDDDGVIFGDDDGDGRADVALDFNGTRESRLTLAPGETRTLTLVTRFGLEPANRSPVANDDEYSTDEGETLNVPAVGVLANDTDADGDAVHRRARRRARARVVDAEPRRLVQLRAGAGFNGTDTFIYKADDGKADSNLALVTIRLKPVLETDRARQGSKARAG